MLSFRGDIEEVIGDCFVQTVLTILVVRSVQGLGRSTTPRLLSNWRDEMRMDSLQKLGYEQWKYKQMIKLGWKWNRRKYCWESPKTSDDRRKS